MARLKCRAAQPDTEQPLAITRQHFHAQPLRLPSSNALFCGTSQTTL